jgi:hypothetical protein
MGPTALPSARILDERDLPAIDGNTEARSRIAPIGAHRYPGCARFVVGPARRKRGFARKA